MFYFSLIFIICFLASILTGLLGIGGGILIIPAFLFIAPLSSVDFSIHYIVGVSAQCILINSLFALYYKRTSSFIPLKHILVYGLSLIPGTLLGSFIQNKIHEPSILLIYILIFISSFYLTNKNPKNSNNPNNSSTNEWSLPLISKNKFILISFLFFTIGVLSSIVGIGGAIFYIVILKYFYRLSIKDLVPTSTVLILISSLFMVVENLYLQEDLSCSLLPLILISSMMGVYVGTRLYRKFSPSMIHLTFNVVMVLSLIRVIVSFVQSLG